MVKSAKHHLYKFFGILCAILLLLTAVATKIAPQTASAAPNSVLNFQGRLLDDNGNLVPDGFYNIEFKIYDVSTSGSALWTETYYDSNGATAGNDNRLRVVNGYFSVSLGSITAFSNINWDQQLWLTMNIGGSTQTASPTYDGEMSPRIRLTGVPLAFVANNVNSGSTNAASTNSNNVSIQSGNAAGTTSNSGNINIDAGTATGTTGTINLGASNASALVLGRAGLNVSVPGTLSVGVASSSTGTLTFRNAGGSGGIVLTTASPGTSTYTITLPAATGTVCLTSGNCAGVGGTGDILQNGNSFTAAMTIGTNDNYDVNIESNGNTRLTVQADGDVAFDADTLFVDANNNRVSIGTTTTTNAVLTIDENAPNTVNGSIVYVTGQLTSNTNSQTGLTVIADANPSAAGDAENYSGANIGVVSTSDDFSTDDQLSGLGASASYSGTGTLDRALGVGALVGNMDAGTIDSATALVGGVVNVTGTINVAAGLGIDVVNVAGTINTAVGISIDEVVEGTNNINLFIGDPDSYPTGDWAIYNASTADNYFAGNLAIGTNVATNKLTIEGSAGSSSSIRGSITNTNADGYAEFQAVNDDGSYTGFATYGSNFAEAALQNAGQIYTREKFIFSANVDDETGGPGEILFTTGGWDIDANTRLLIDSVGNIVVGVADTTGALLVLDTKTGSGDPSGTNGAMYYNSNSGKFRCYENSAWKDCDTTGAGGVTTVGTIDTQTPSANGAVISGSSIYLQSASATEPGLVNTTTQSFAGTKTFTGDVNIGDATSDTITFTGRVNSHILPSVNDTYDLGSDSNRWRDLYLGGETIHLGTSTSDEAAISYTTSTDSLTIKNATNSTTAFQVQNSSNGNLFNIDSTNAGAITLLGNYSGEISGWTANTNVFGGTIMARKSAAATIANGHIYVMGGIDSSSGWHNDIVYAKINADGSVGTWASITGPDYMIESQLVYANGYLYAIGGGNSGSPSSDVWFAKVNADGTLGTWTATTSLWAARYDHAAVAYGGYIYVFAGLASGGSASQSVRSAKINADGTLASSWTSLNNLPYSSGTDGWSATVANGYVYLAGDMSGNHKLIRAKLNSDGTVGSWSSSDSAPTNGIHNAGLVAMNGYLYFVGGGNGSDVPQSAVKYAALNADGSIGSWTTSSNPLTNARSNAVTVALNGYIYVIGGNQSAFGAPQDTVYYASTARVKVGGSLDLVSMSGENLHEGNTGGSITAGNGNFVGTLQVQGAASFNQGVSVNGILSATVLAVNAPSGFTGNIADFRVDGAQKLRIDQDGTILFGASVDCNGGCIRNGELNSFGNLLIEASSGNIDFTALDVKFSTVTSVQIGTSDTTGTLLVLDTKTGSGDPTGTNGGMYYNSNSGKFRCYENGSWKDCISSASGLSATLTDNIADAWDVQEGTNNYININTTNSSEAISFGNATTNPDFNFLGSGNLTVDGGTLFVDGANDQVGIGATSLVSNMHLQVGDGTGNVNVLLHAGASSTSTLYLDDSGSNRLEFDNSTDTIILTANGGIATIDYTGLAVNRDFTVQGNTTLGNASSDTITFTGRVNSNFLPSASSTYSIGSTSQRWGNAYFDNVISLGTSSSDESTFTYNSVADSLTIKNATNSIAAFQIQNASSVNLFNVDSINSRIEVNADLEVQKNISSPYGGIGKIGNYIRGSEELSDTGFWTRTNLTSVTDGATAPDGVADADTIVSSGSGTHTLTQSNSLTSNADYTFSIWVKTNSGTQPIQLRIDGTSSTPTTGTAASYTATTTWQRFVVTQAFTGTPATIIPTLIITNNSATIVAWGAQLVIDSSAGVYTPAIQGDAQFSNGGVINGRLNVYGSIFFGDGDGNGTSSVNDSGFSAITGNGFYLWSPNGNVTLEGGSSNSVIFRNMTTDITTHTNETLTIAPNGTGDVAISIDDDTNLQLSGTITNTGSAQDITLTLGNDSNADTVSALNIAVTSANTGDADILRGINIADLSSPQSVTEYALQIGSGWDANLFFNDTTTQIQIAGGGTFTFEDSSGNDLITIADAGTTGNVGITGTLTVANITPSANLTVGTSDTTGTLLVLDTKTGSGDPTGVNGGMYYNSNSNKFRCYENSTWKDCIGAGGGGSGDITNGGNTTGAAITIGTNDAYALNLETGGTTVATFSSTGQAAFQNSTDSITAFQVLNANDDVLLNIDTDNGRFGWNVPSWALPQGTAFHVYSATSSDSHRAIMFETNTVASLATGQVGTTFWANADSSSNMDYNGYYSTNIHTNLNKNANSTNASIIALSLSNWFDGTGTVSEYRGIEIGVSNADGGTIGNFYGIDVVTSSLDAGTLTNNYGIRIQNQTVGTNDYGLYIGGADTYALWVDAGVSRFDGQVIIGESDTTGVLLVLDTKTSSGDPTGTNGAMYYNSNSNKFRCYENGSWTDCIGTGGSSHFTDAGAYTYLTSTTDEVLIGTSTQNSGVKLTVSASGSDPLYVNETSGTVATFRNSSGTGSGGISIQGSSSGAAFIDFGDGESASAGFLGYDNTVEGLFFGNGNVGVSWRIDVDGHLVPDDDDTYNIGSSSKRVQDLYLGPASLHIGTNGDEGVLSYDTTGNGFKFNQSVSVVASGYLNFGDNIGASGYGIRDNGGIIQVKDFGGNWINITDGLGGGGGVGGGGVDDNGVIPNLEGYTTNSPGSATEFFDLTVPADTEDGDLLLAIITSRDCCSSVGTHETPVGWRQENSTVTHNGGFGDHMRTTVYSRIASGNTPGSTISFDYDDNNDWTVNARGAMLRISGASAVTPVDAIAVNTNLSDEDLIVPALTTMRDNTLGIAFMGAWDDPINGVTVPNWDNVTHYDNNYLKIMERDLPDDQTYTESDSGDDYAWTQMTIALAIRPVETGGFYAGEAIFQDDFNDNSVNATKWDQTTASSGTISETGQQMVLGLPTNGSGSASLQSDAGYDIRDRWAGVELVSANHPEYQSYSGLFLNENGGDDYLAIFISENNLMGLFDYGGGATTVFSTGYNSSVHKFLRIRESSGLTYWETSTDGDTWTTHYAQSIETDLSDMKVELEAAKYGTSGATSNFIYDNLYVGTSDQTYTFNPSNDLVLDGGNTLGANLTVGTLDNFNFSLLTGGHQAVTLNYADGSALFHNASDSTTAFQVQNAAGTSLFTIDSANSRVYIGNPSADAVGTLLVVDTKNTSGDPTGVNGAIYYNSNMSKFRCYEGGQWRDCIGGDTYRTSPGDKPPASPHAKDDEFNDASFDTGKWTWRNQDAATVGETNQGLLELTSDTNADLNIIEQDAPSAPYTITAKVSGFNGDNGNAGIALVNSSNGRVVTLNYSYFDAGADPNVAVDQWTTTDTYSATTSDKEDHIFARYIRIEDDGTDLIMYLSNDGIVWAELSRQTRASFLGTPTKIGIVVTGDGDITKASVDWFRVNWDPDYVVGGGSSTSSVVTGIGTIDSQTKSSNGAVINNNSLIMQSADALNPGLVTTGTQTFAGAKTFSGTLTVANITPSGNLTIGTSDTTGTLLILDTKTDSGDPSGTNGGMYYNSNSNKFRCYQNGSWVDCIGAGSSLFTDGGAVSYLTSTTDDFVLGGTSSTNSAFFVDVSTGMTVLGNASLAGVLGLADGFGNGGVIGLTSGGVGDGHLYFQADGTNNVVAQFGTASNAVFEVSTPGGQSLFWNDLRVNGTLALTGSTDLVTESNQHLTIAPNGTGDVYLGAADSVGTMLVLDSKSSSGEGAGITGATNGAMYYNSTDNKFRCYEGGAWKNCLGVNSVRETLSPEFPGATLTADGSNNTGTMTSDFCSGSSWLNIPSSSNPCAATENHNYYSWTSASGTNDYDIFIRYQVPSDFNTFTSLNAYGWRTTSSSSAQIRWYKGATACNSSLTNVSTSNTTWTETSVPNNSCTLAANDVLTIRISLSAAASEFARIGEIRFDYTR